MAWLAWLLGASMAALADDGRSIGPPEAPQTTEGCEIVVEGLPHWAKPHHWVEISGGRMNAGRWWLAHGLGALDVGDGFTATCEFKSPGYAPLRRSVSILPGANEVFVRMSPLAREPSPRP